MTTHDTIEDRIYNLSDGWFFEIYDEDNLRLYKTVNNTHEGRRLQEIMIPVSVVSKIIVGLYKRYGTKIFTKNLNKANGGKKFLMQYTAPLPPTLVERRVVEDEDGKEFVDSVVNADFAEKMDTDDLVFLAGLISEILTERGISLDNTIADDISQEAINKMNQKKLGAIYDKLVGGGNIEVIEGFDELNLAGKRKALIDAVKNPVATGEQEEDDSQEGGEADKTPEGTDDVSSAQPKEE